MSELLRPGSLLAHATERLPGWREIGMIPDDEWRELAATGIVGRERIAEVAATIAELARTGDVGLVGTYAINEICHRLLIEVGDNGLRDEVAAGKVRLALALTERGAGSDMSAIATRARPREGGETLDGEKRYISNAHVADYFLTTARSGTGTALPTFTLYRVPAERVEVTQMAGVGARLMALGVVTLTAVPVTGEDVLGRRGRGFRHVTAALMFERALIAVICVELAEHVLGLLRARMRARWVAGLPLAEHEYQRLRFARWHGRHRVLRSALGPLIDAIDAKTADDADIVALKIEAAELLRELVVEGQHLFGAESWIEGGPLAAMYDDVRWLTLGGGTTEALLGALADRSLS